MITVIKKIMVFLLSPSTADVILTCYFLPTCCKAVIKVYFLPLVQHSFICSCSCDAFVPRRVWRWKVCFFWGQAVAPAVFQVFALLCVAGGLRFLPWPRPDSVYRLQQRWLTTTNYTWNRTNYGVKHCWRQQKNL